MRALELYAFAPPRGWSGWATGGETLLRSEGPGSRARTPGDQGAQGGHVDTPPASRK